MKEGELPKTRYMAPSWAGEDSTEITYWRDGGEAKAHLEVRFVRLFTQMLSSFHMVTLRL